LDNLPDKKTQKGISTHRTLIFATIRKFREHSVHFTVKQKPSEKIRRFFPSSCL